MFFKRMCKKSLFVGAVLIISIILPGCFESQISHYDVEMMVDQDQLIREVSFKDISKEEQKHITNLYPNNVEGKYVGQFYGNLPDDIGGSGSFNCFKTEMGSTFTYIERFRGNDSLVVQLEDSLEAANMLTDYLTGWLESELSGEKGYAALKTFCDQSLRQDITNMSIYYQQMILFDDDPNDESEQEILFRMAQYLHERDYFDIEQLPMFFRVMNESDPDKGSKIVMNHLQHFIAKKMGYASGKRPAALDFLSDAETAGKSWNKYIEGTSQYRGEMESQKLSGPNSDISSGSEWLAERVTDKIGFDLCLWCDEVHLKLTLRCETEPYETNGLWCPEKKTVRWDKKREKRRHYPTLLYAIWSQPDELFQTKLFGKVILKDNALGEYCLWQKALNQDEEIAWQHFLIELKPGKNLLSQITDYSFTEPHKILDEGRKILLKAF